MFYCSQSLSIDAQPSHVPQASMTIIVDRGSRKTRRKTPAFPPPLCFQAGIIYNIM